MEDPVPMITKRHFESGLSSSRKSVTEIDLNRYEEFKRKFDPQFVTNQNEGSKIQWPDDDGNKKEKKDEDLGLYD